SLEFFGTPLVIEPSPGQLTSDAGLRPIRQFGERIGLTRAFAGARDDPRDPDLVEHTPLERVRSRIYGILAGSLDQTHDLEKLRAFSAGVAISFAEEKPGDGPLHLAGRVGDVVIELYPLACQCRGGRRHHTPGLRGAQPRRRRVEAGGGGGPRTAADR